MTVPARDRRGGALPVRPPRAPARPASRWAAVSGRWADAAEFSLPVYTPATTEAFAVYGTVDEGAIAQPVIAPSDVYTQFGGLEISTSSTALQALSDAVLYLTSYPYECSEQLASRLLAVAALRDVLSAFKAEGLPHAGGAGEGRAARHRAAAGPAERGRRLARLVARPRILALLQHPCRPCPGAGPREGLPGAGGDARRAPWATCARSSRTTPRWYSQDVRNTLTSYALYVRALLGDVDSAARARKLVNEAGPGQAAAGGPGLAAQRAAATTPQSARSWPRSARTWTTGWWRRPGAANFTTSYREEDGYLLLASNRRADGVLLEALIAGGAAERPDPQDRARPAGAPQCGAAGATPRRTSLSCWRWTTYFNTYEAQTPDFVARVWLGEQYVAGFSFEGRTHRLPGRWRCRCATWPQQPGEQNLILSKEGQGRLYYRLGLSYAPTDLTCEPLDQGFTVQRTYEAVDDPADVRRDEEGVWHVRAGARVRVRLTMVAPSRRYHVALVDPLPAGFEAHEPGAGRQRQHPAGPAGRRRRDALLVVAAGPGTSTRTCATSAPRPLPRCCGRACTPTPTWRAPPRPATFVVPADQGRGDVLARGVWARRDGSGGGAVERALWWKRRREAGAICGWPPPLPMFGPLDRQGKGWYYTGIQ